MANKNFTTPDWLSGGIIYQIFPDRFFNSGEEKQNVPEDRFIVTDTKKQPEHRQKNGPCSLGNDYYCGDLKGIEQKLDYIKSLGVNCIYLNPIFKEYSNFPVSFFFLIKEIFIRIVYLSSFFFK